MSKYRERAAALVAQMTLEEKVYQMSAVTPEQLTGITQVTMGGQTTKDALTQYPVGTIIYGDKNVIDEAQITEMLTNTKDFIDVAPFLAVEEETGNNSIVSIAIGKNSFSEGYDYRNSDASEVTAAYTSLNSILKNCGFNLNIAPLADMWTEPANTYIARRSFGNTFEVCAKHTVAAIEAAKDNGFNIHLKKAEEVLKDWYKKL